MSNNNVINRSLEASSISDIIAVAPLLCFVV